jgi:hypothetical protein
MAELVVRLPTEPKVRGSKHQVSRHFCARKNDLGGFFETSMVNNG